MLRSILTDPALALSFRYVLGALFTIAAVHKVAAPTSFVSTLRTYRLVPSPMVAAVAAVLIISEAATALALFANQREGGVLAAVLLTTYTAAIAINLWRGRRDIDCGCAGPYVRQSLSYRLVARNLLFLGVAAVTLLPTGIGRDLGVLDWFTALAAAGTFALLFFTVNQLAAFGRGSDLSSN